MIIQRSYKALLLVLVAVISTGIMSCEEYNEWEQDASSSRLFRPSELTAAVDGVTATLKWKGKPNTNIYQIELSKDSLMFREIVKTYKGKVTKEADGYSFVIPDLLDPQTQYSARVKGIDSTAVTPESGWTSVAFKTATEQIMNTVTSEDLTINSVKLKWRAGSQVTHIMLGSARYDITSEEAVAGEKTITGITPETSYSAVIYLNTTIRGSQTFVTPADLPTGPGVILVGASDDLATMIQNVVSGTTFVLLKGTKYTSDVEIIIPENVSFNIWGQDGANKAIIAFNGFKLPANAGTIKFENLDFTGYQNGDATRTKRNYIFNQSVASNTNEIIFENCIIRNLVNSAMRLQTATNINIGKFYVNKCFVYDIGDNAGAGNYAFIHNSVASKINNIILTNSTFYKIGYSIILHGAAPSSSVLVENNTFNNVVGNGRYLIDYNSQTITSFIYRNNVLGKTLSPSLTARGIRAATVPTVINSYKTTDAVLSSNPIPNILDYNKASTDLFTDPDNGNFSVKDATFPGKSDSGDPRWIP